MIIFNKKRGIILYIVFSLISPNLKVGDTITSFNILAFFLVIIILLIKSKLMFKIYRGWLYRQCLWLYFFVFIISSLMAVSMYSSMSVNWFSILATFRVICIIYMLQYVLKEKAETVLDNIIFPVLLVNLVFSIIQLTIPESTAIFYDLYYKTSLTPLDYALEMGYFTRAYGTFGTPVLLGVFSLFCFAIYLGYYLDKQPCKLLNIKIIISLACGLLAMSKTVLLGVPVLVIVYCIMIILRISKVNSNRKILLAPVVVIVFFIIIIQLLEQHGTAIAWYTDYLTHPLDSFDSRYSSNTGLLSDMYSIIKENLIIGVGSTAIEDVFIGDSMYIVILYNTGIVGFLLYFEILISATLKNLVNKRSTALLCCVAVCLAGLAAPVHLHVISAPVIAYIFQKAETCDRVL